jgi:hypothetical protein
LIDVLTKGGNPHLDGKTGREVLEFSVGAHQSAKANHEIVLDQKPIKR